MSDDELTYEDVIDVWEREKDSSQPCTLPNNFYKRLRDYIRDLEREIEDIGVPPKNKREKRTQKQYQRVKKISGLFFKERQKKIVLAAFHKSLGESVTVGDLTEEELELLDDMSKLLTEFKNEVFLGEYKRKTEETESPKESSFEEKKEPEDVDIEQEHLDEEGLEGEEIKEPEEPIEEESPELEESTQQKEETEEKENITEKEKIPQKSQSQEEVLVHITEDVPPFVDMDTTYDLKKEDVLTLREDIAEVLIEREKARKIKI